MTEYVWRKGQPAPPVEAQVFGETLEKIEAQKGSVDAADIVAAAREKRSPLHKAFNWDDADAAEKYRVDQARKWIGALTTTRVKIEPGQRQPREYFSVREAPGEKAAYRSRDAIMGSSVLRRDLIQTARRELEGFINRYQSVLSGSLARDKITEALDIMRDEADTLATAATRRVERQQERQARDGAAVQA